MNAVCKVCYRVESAVGESGCKGCKGLTRKSCESCQGDQHAAPCASCYPDRNFRWTALQVLETGKVASRFDRNEFCGDCLSLLCDCGISDYEEAIFEYLEKIDPGFVRPETVPDLKAWTLAQIADYEWAAAYSAPHPLLKELSHQTVIKGVSFCRQCWRPQVATCSGCYCTGLTDCSCSSETETDPCATCWPEGALRHQLAMEFLAAS
jgi:hypothetical protein